MGQTERFPFCTPIHGNSPAVNEKRARLSSPLSPPQRIGNIAVWISHLHWWLFLIVCVTIDKISIVCSIYLRLNFDCVNLLKIYINKLPIYRFSTVHISVNVSSINSSRPPSFTIRHPDVRRNIILNWSIFPSGVLSAFRLFNYAHSQWMKFPVCDCVSKHIQPKCL